MEIKHLLEVARMVSEKTEEDIDRDMLHQSSSDIQNEISYVLEHRDVALEILRVLFNKNIPVSADFYNRLREVLLLIGFNKSSYQLIGILLIDACRQLKPDEAEELLNIALRDEVDIFLVIKYLPTFLAEYDISSDFASRFFQSIEAKIRGDLASGDFYAAVEQYGIAFPEAGIAVIGKYYENGFDDGTLHIASILLGYIRAAYGEDEGHRADIKRVDRQLSEAIDTKARVCYHRSWAFTFIKGKIQIEELATHLQSMLEGSVAEKDEAYAVMHRCTIDKISEIDFIQFALKWLEQHTSSQLSPESKYWIVEIIWRLCRRGMENADTAAPLENLNRLLIKIQPISLESRGTWNTVSHYLHDILILDRNKFAEAFTGLVDSNPDGMIQLFKEDIFSYAISEAAKYDISDMVANLLFSTDKSRRILGVNLFNKLPKMSYSSELIAKYDTKRLLAAIDTLTFRALEGDDIARLLILLEPRFRNEDSSIQSTFKSNAVYQAVNYPGAVLQSFKSVEDPSSFLLEVIRSAENYFDRLSRLNNSSVNSFTFPGYEEATAKADRDLSSQIYKGAKEKSIFMKLARNVEIIYGNTFSFLAQSSLSTPASFSEASHSMEFPRIEIIDPEGAAIRRIQAIRRSESSDEIS